MRKVAVGANKKTGKPKPPPKKSLLLATAFLSGGLLSTTSHITSN